MMYSEGSGLQSPALDPVFDWCLHCKDPPTCILFPYHLNIYHTQSCIPWGGLSESGKDNEYEAFCKM